MILGFEQGIDRDRGKIKSSFDMLLEESLAYQFMWFEVGALMAQKFIGGFSGAFAGDLWAGIVKKAQGQTTKIFEKPNVIPAITGPGAGPGQPGSSFFIEPGAEAAAAAIKQSAQEIVSYAPGDLWDIDPTAAARAAEIAAQASKTAAVAGGTGEGIAKGLEKGAKGVDPVKAALTDLEVSGKRNLAVLQAEAQGLEMAMRGVDAAIRGMATIRLPGMQAAEDEMFAMEIAIDKARLAELGMGDATGKAASSVKDAGKALGAEFDELSAQQREVRDGIPVALQRWQWEQQQAAQKAATAMSRQVITGTATSPLQSQSDALQKQLEAQRLMYRIQFAPQQREAEKLFKALTETTPPELTLEEWKTKLVELSQAKDTLSNQQEEINQKVEEEQGVLKTINDLQADSKTTLAEVQTLSDIILGRRTETVAAEQALLGIYQDQYDVLKAAAEVVNSVPSPPGEEAPPEPDWTGMATGGRALTGGGAIVGERGPERVMLPAGAAVLPVGHRGSQHKPQLQRHLEYPGRG